MCGEHLTHEEMVDYALGIIPACAGNTGTVHVPKSALWDHPRVCGEHSLLKGQKEPGVGSSPRVRGTRDHIQTRAVLFGIIPACAGNTDPADLRDGYNGDHPRVCGEHSICWAVRFAALGSSPRVRGTLFGM